ncbi:uncharacterized protein FFB20_08832 [Fusarium fujikuroi]|nr:hypothetical protein CEK27_005620 [Fusarium fujikuroi]SCN75869.1 uncharacterized protein FFE2_03241 [Fusarium fujikuroi]SCN90945.1 uncharacterized protein FFB20_08832 [Fusarium fujikuroi]SCN94235.1 uncharacterized protein FFC1_06820 [Fusarium fujikuroi]SCO48938.1 uncharacterized protein FFNC_12415 [Fusarium fujikuroi]
MSMNIDQLVQDCAKGFERIEVQLGHRTIVNVAKYDEFVEFVEFKNLKSRFTRWMGNIGALRVQAGSVDHKLQKRTRLKLQVCRILNHIQRLLKDALAITAGNEVPWDQIDEEEGSQSEDDAETLSNFPEREIDQILSHISDAIDNLLYLNPVLRGPLADARTTGEPSSPFEPFDIQHVRSKYPELDSGIAERLGKAISARRQLFKHKPDNQSHYSHSGTRISPESEPLIEHIALEDLTHLSYEANETGLDISSATSCSPVDDTRASRVPVIPQEATQAKLFHCVYCQSMIQVSSESAWKKHVYQDLQPYICLEEDCLTPRYQYARRRDWMKHMLEEHWRLYFCPFGCDPRSMSSSECKEHLDQNHGDHTSATEMEDLVQLGTFNETAFPKRVSCIFCNLELEDIKTYESHVGRHQRRLALFAMPLNVVEREPEHGRDEVEQLSAQDRAYEKRDNAMQEQVEKEEPQESDGQSAVDGSLCPSISAVQIASINGVVLVHILNSPFEDESDGIVIGMTYSASARKRI